MLNRLTLLLVTMLRCFCAPAQDNMKVTSYNTEDGLPQSSVWSIVQDRHGFMWFGTSDGVCRFDGYTFTVYRDSANESNFDAYVKFYRDSNSRIWTISQSSLCFYDEIKDRFIHVFSHARKVTRSYNSIVGEDARCIIAGIAGYGIVQVDKRTLRAEVIDNKGTAPIRQCTNGIVCGNEIWIACAESKSYVYNIDTHAIDTIGIAGLTTMLNYNDSEIVSVASDAVIVFKKKSHEYRIFPLAFKVGAAVTGVKRISPQELLVISAGGITNIETTGWKITKHLRSFTPADSGTFIYAQSMYFDRSGNMWLGTNGDGVKKIMYQHKKFRHYISPNSKGNLVKAIYSDNDRVYVGYYQQGMDVFDKHKGLLRSVSLYPRAATSNSVLAFGALDSTHLIYYSGGVNGIGVYTKNGSTVNTSQSFAKVLGKPDLPNNMAPFFERSGNNIYSIVDNKCVVSFAATGPRLTPNLIGCVENEIFDCAYTADDGVLWLGSMNAAFYLKNGALQKLHLPELIHVKSISQDKDHNMWLATSKGIYVLDRNNKVVQHYTDRNGLANQFIYGLLRDNDGNMWFSHNKGISVFDYAKKSFRHYDYDDGLQSNEFNTGAYFKSASGELFFGGLNGVNSFYPQDVKDNPNVPDARITSIKLFDLPMKTDTSSWNVHTLSLPYGQNTLSFEFSALEFTNSAKNQYAYMMEGIDDKWINSGDRHFARYAGLAPGNYVFKVIASNDDGIWQAIPTTIAISIVPPFWQLLWFRFLVAVFLIGTVAALLLWIQQQRHKRTVRALELQQKIQAERQRISRDLHDTVGTQLSLISNNIEWVVRPLKQITDDEKTEKLHFVNAAARDIIATLRETIWALNRQQITLEEFTDKLKAFIQKQLSVHAGISLTMNEQPGTDIVLGPSEALNLFRICQEAIANALKYSDATTLHVDIVSEHGKYRIRIADNGKGFDPERVNVSVQNGIENMKYRAQDMNCELAINTKPNSGTTITISKK